MADENKILLQIDIDSDSLVNKIVKSKDEIAKLKKEIEDLRISATNFNDTGDAASFDATNKAIVEKEADLRSLGKEQKNYQKQLDLIIASNNAESGSYEQLLRQQQLAQIELKNLEGTLLRNADGGYILTDAYMKAADQVTLAKQALINFDQGIKDGRSNVGNYEAAIKAALSQLTPLTQRLTVIESTISQLNSDFKAGTVSQKEFTSTFNTLNNELNTTASEISKVNESINTILSNTNEVAEGFKTLRQRLKEATDEATRAQDKFEAGIINEKQLVYAQQKVANLKEEVSDFNKRVEALNPEAKFKAFTQVAGSLAGGISAATGAMALFGDQSEETAQFLLKVQGALAFASGLNQLAELGDALSNVKVILGLTSTAQSVQNTAQAENVVVTEAQTVVTGEMAVATETAAVSTGVLSTAINVLLGPIGLAIIGIGAIATAYSLLSSASKTTATDLKAVKNEQEYFNTAIKDSKEKFSSQISSMQAIINLRKEQGASAKEISDLETELNLKKKVALIDESVLTKQHLEELNRLQGEFTQTKIEQLSDEEQKTALAQKDANAKEIEETIKHISEIDSAKRTLSLQQEADQLTRERSAREEATAISLSLIKNQQTREIAEIKNQTTLKLNAIKGVSDSENQLRAALISEQEENISQIRRKFLLQEIEEQNRLAVLSTVENTSARIDAEIESEKRIREFTLADNKLTESAKQVIIAESETKIRQLEDTRIQVTNERNKKLLDLEQRQIDAIVSIQNNADVGTDVLSNETIKLSAIQEELTKEINLKNIARNEDLRANEKYIDDQIAALQNSTTFKSKTVEEQTTIVNEIVSTGRKTENQINATYDAEYLAQLSKSAKESRDVIIQSNDQRIQDLVDFENLKLAAAGTPDEVVDAQFQILDALEKQEIEHYAVRIKNKEGFEKQVTFINEKYNKMRAETQRQYEDKQFAVASDILGKTAALFKKGSAEYKIFATGQALIDTYRGATAALAPPPTGAGPLLGPLLAAVTIASGLANIAKINSVENFEKGGNTLGDIIQQYNPTIITSHAAGGWKNSPTLGLIGEKGSEWVAPHFMTTHPATAPIINGLERFRETGVLAFADGGFAANQLGAPVSESLGMEQIVEAIAELKIYTVVESITEAQGNQAKTISRADV